MTITYTETGQVIKTWEQIRSLAENFAKGIEEAGLCPRIEVDNRKMKLIGILMQNCWMAPVTIIAGYYSDVTSFYIYTDPPDHYQYNVNQGLFDTLIMNTPMIESYLVPLAKKELRAVKNVVLDEFASPEQIEKLKSYGIKIYFFNELIENGKKSSVKLERHNLNSDVYVVSTSGSTGYPKGATLGHDAVFHNAAINCGPWFDRFKEGPQMLNNLTLGFGTVLGYNTVTLCRGGRLLYVEKKCANFIEEIRLADPTFLVLSPLAYNKMYQGIMQVINGLPKDKKEGLLKLIDMKTKYYKVTKKNAHPFFDKHLEPFVSKLFGPNLKLFLNIGAAINEDVLTFFRVISSRSFVNMYGSCEMGGPATVASETDNSEIAGWLAPWYAFKLVDVPEKNYLVTDKPYPRGEILVKGTTMNRYFNEPKKTQETIDSEGYLHTGDIGVLRPDFSVSIIDRKNQVIKLTCVLFLCFLINNSLNLLLLKRWKICTKNRNTLDKFVFMQTPAAIMLSVS